METMLIHIQDEILATEVIRVIKSKEGLWDKLKDNLFSFFYRGDMTHIISDVSQEPTLSTIKMMNEVLQEIDAT